MTDSIGRHIVRGTYKAKGFAHAHLKFIFGSLIDIGPFHDSRAATYLCFTVSIVIRLWAVHHHDIVNRDILAVSLYGFTYLIEVEFENCPKAKLFERKKNMPGLAKSASVAREVGHWM